MADIEQAEILKIGKLVLHKNALIYDSTVIQISNICSVWVADQSYVIKHNVPSWIKALGLIGFLALISGVFLPSWEAIIAGAVMLAAALYGLNKHKPSTAIEKYALGVERSSGRVKLFTSNDKRFVMQAAQALLNVIAQGQERSERMVINFDNKQINIENAVGSNIIGGDVTNSLVEAL